MIAILRTAGFVALVVSAVLLGEQRPGFAQSTSFDDTARFLAGMPPSAESALAPLTQDPAWQQHARYFNSAFGNVDKNQFSKVRAWSSAKLTTPHQVLFYFFSGPDFLYADAFFPNASTYVMAGLEPVGPIPDLLRLPRGSLDDALRHIESSLSTILTISFFKTHDMRMTLGASSVSGTLPILYVFLARSGKTIRDVTLIKLDDQGLPQPESAPSPPGMKNPAHGVKIVFTDEDGREKTLYYFGTNVAGAGFKSSGLEKFCDRFGTGDAFIKSASYLLHGNGFTDVRNFLLQHTALVLQDDTGIPVSYLSSDKWELRPFGRYSGPITMFARNYQPRLTQLFQSGRAEPLSFGLGYQWRVLGSNLLLATRTGSGAEPQISSQSNSAEPNSNQAGASLEGKPLASTTPDTPSPSSVAPTPTNSAPKKTTKKTQRQQRANNTVTQQPFFWPFFWGQRH
jgi:hypothetical protein